MEFRTMVVAVYIFSTLFLCLVVMNDSFKSHRFFGNSYWHKIWVFSIWM